MQRFLLLATTVILSSAVAIPAAATSEFTVNLPPNVAAMLYMNGSMANAFPGCLPDANNCDFGLELGLTLEVDEADQATAVVSKLKLHGNDAAFAAHPEQRTLIEASAAGLFANSTFDVAYGPALNRTVMTADFPGDDLVLEFSRKKLIGMSGGSDLRPVDGPGYAFSYVVPEPSGLSLALAAVVSSAAWYARKRVSVSN